MAIITGYTAEQMEIFNNASVVSGSVNTTGGLILKTRGGTDIDAGNVKGPIGNTGPAGPTGIAGGTTAVRNTIYPLPTTAAAMATLANKVITFYNTTTEKLETYYAKTGTAGLTVTGVSGDSGWYENQYMSKFPKGVIREFVNDASSGNIDKTSWHLNENLQVPLIAGRRYRAYYKVTHLSASGNMAISVLANTSATTDNNPNSGTQHEGDWTLYAAPTAGQGKTDILEFTWVAAQTGTFNFKISTLRATLNGYYYFKNRRLAVYDEGLSAPAIAL